MESIPFRVYLKELQKNLSTGQATEQTHRSALKTLLESVGENITAINEPKRIECGAPDYIIARAGTPIGYVEAKDVGRSLDAAERSEQLRRYRESLNNLILTDYLEFRWYVEGEHRETARLATLTIDGRIRTRRGGIQGVSGLLQKFLAQAAPTVGTPKELAQRMAALARMTRDLIEETFKRESEEGALHAQLKAFRETLIPFLTPAQFADMYAQTITYGLFAARVRVPTGQDFTREKAAWNLPKTNPFLRRLFNQIAGPGLDDALPGWWTILLTCWPGRTWRRSCATSAGGRGRKIQWSTSTRPFLAPTPPRRAKPVAYTTLPSRWSPTSSVPSITS